VVVVGGEGGGGGNGSNELSAEETVVRIDAVRALGALPWVQCRPVNWSCANHHPYIPLPPPPRPLPSHPTPAPPPGAVSNPPPPVAGLPLLRILPLPPCQMIVDKALKIFLRLVPGSDD
jgi:hypothetical protein